MILTTLILVIIILCGIHFSIHYSKKGKLLNKLVGPDILPIIGSSIGFIVGTNVTMFYHVRSLSNRFKSGYKVWGVHIRTMSLLEPHDIEVVLSNPRHITKSILYDNVKPWLKEGLLTTTGEKWHIRRKILTPTFHFNILSQFCTIFKEQSINFVEMLRSEVDKQETSIQPYLTEVALNSICETSMGRKLNSTSKNMNSYVSSIYEFGEYFLYRMARPWLHPDFIFNFTNIGRQQNKILPILHGFTRNVIRERREDKKIFGNKFEVETSLEDTLGSKKRLAMLDLLLKAESDGIIDEDGIREEVDTFMFAGHDTTTMAMTFCLMLLANNPEHQEQVFLEINEIFGDSPTPTISNLNNLPYLDRCIKESLRLYPSVPAIGRTLNENVQFKNFLLPAETTCMIHIFDLHRNPKIYPNPEKFDPDRFLPENTLNRHPYAYLPFSAGPRNCIGQKFALLEMKSVISSVLRNYKLVAVTRPEDIIFTADLVLRSHNPIKVKFTSR